MIVGPVKHTKKIKILNHNTKSLLLKQHFTPEHMKQPHSALNEMYTTKKCKLNWKHEWRKYCKTRVDRKTVSDPA